ncbi:MAG TPA: hypothetical protein VLM85_26910 [Polyangiaceae bacterium]|nr:hypothetical protein [Polyangiaceae bacterium]
MRAFSAFALSLSLAASAGAQDASVAARPLLDAGVRTRDAAAAPAASQAPAATTQLPSGHPGTGHGQQAPGPALFRPPADSSEDDPAVAPGTIHIELRDAHDGPIANHPVELGIVVQSIAKGDNHKHLSAATDAAGVVDFTGLETGSDVAYRVTAHEGAAAFGAQPFRLSPQRGTHVVLHVYPPTSDYARGAIILSRGIVYLEVKDDRIQLQQRIDIHNGSPVAWVPNNLVLRLPEDFTALNNVQQMSDVGIDAMPKEGAKLHGTFGPGDQSVLFSWQVPYSGQSDVDIEIGSPPNLGTLVVRAAAAPGMRLEVDGFPAATSQQNEEGQRELVTGRQLEQGDAPMRSVHIALRGLPTPGPSRLIGTVLAALGVAAGIYVGVNRTRARKGPKAGRRDQARVLHEMEQLERSRAAGDVGPKTYERARRELVDELAQILATKEA